MIVSLIRTASSSGIDDALAPFYQQRRAGVQTGKTACERSVRPNPADGWNHLPGTLGAGFPHDSLANGVNTANPTSEDVIMEALGIDIGGSGIKGAIVDCSTGSLRGERFRVATPRDSCPRSVGEAVAKVAEHFSWQGPLGCGFPGVVRQGVVANALNLAKSWAGVHLPDLLRSMTGCQSWVINDADAAGLGEMRFGAGRGELGKVMMVTIGTGLGTALFVQGHLWANSELGSLPWKGSIAEAFASDRARKVEGLSRKEWAGRFNDYLRKLRDLLWPDLFIIGGGASKKFETFAEYLDADLPLCPAQLLNQAGIIGAATHACQQEGYVGLE
jgi:polyphosphate glucokinase